MGHLFVHDKSGFNFVQPRKKLKAQVLDELQSLEENGGHNGAHYDYLSQKLKDFEQNEIEGFKMQVKNLPTFHKNEPDIAFFPKSNQGLGRIMLSFNWPQKRLGKTILITKT